MPDANLLELGQALGCFYNFFDWPAYSAAFLSFVGKIMPFLAPVPFYILYTNCHFSRRKYRDRRPGQVPHLIRVRYSHITYSRAICMGYYTYTDNDINLEGVQQAYDNPGRLVVCNEPVKKEL